MESASCQRWCQMQIKQHLCTCLGLSDGVLSSRDGNNFRVVIMCSYLKWAFSLRLPLPLELVWHFTVQRCKRAGSTHLSLVGITSLSDSTFKLAVYWISLGCKICQALADRLLWCRGLSHRFWYPVIGCRIQTLLLAGAGDCQLCSFAQPCVFRLIMPPLSGVKASLDWKEIPVTQLWLTSCSESRRGVGQM